MFQVGLDVESEAAATYKNVLTKLPGGMKVVEESYYAIQKTVKEMEDYIMVRIILWHLDNMEGYRGVRFSTHSCIFYQNNRLGNT